MAPLISKELPKTDICFLGKLPGTNTVEAASPTGRQPLHVIHRPPKGRHLHLGGRRHPHGENSKEPDRMEETLAHRAAHQFCPSLARLYPSDMTPTNRESVDT